MERSVLLKEKLIAIHSSPGNKRHGIPHKATWRSAYLVKRQKRSKGKA